MLSPCILGKAALDALTARRLAFTAACLCVALAEPHSGQASRAKEPCAHDIRERGTAVSAARAPKNVHERRRSNSLPFSALIASLGFDRDRIDDRIGKPGPTVRCAAQSPFAQQFPRTTYKEGLHVRFQKTTRFLFVLTESSRNSHRPASTDRFIEDSPRQDRNSIVR